MRLILATVLTLGLLGCPEDEPPGNAVVTVIPGKDVSVGDTTSPADTNDEQDTNVTNDTGAPEETLDDIARNNDTGNEPDTTKLPACKTDDDCADQLKLTACQTPICEDGKCSADAMPQGTPCDDEIPCTVDDICTDGECKGKPECDDQNPCTDDFCNLTTGKCKTIFNSAPCDDGDPCSKPDICKEGQCTSTPIECPACKTADDCQPLDDGNACNGTLECVEGKCITDPNSVIECDNSLAGLCEELVCNPETGLCQSKSLEDGADCDTESLCDFGGSCIKGECVAIPKDCDDGNQCTSDKCNPETGCENTPGPGLKCSDSDPCTLNDKCTDDLICQGQPKECDSQTACLLSICVDGECVTKPNTENTCDDNNPCTKDSCNADGECINTPVSGEKCDDGNLCTLDDTCNKEGECAGQAKTCPDKQLCNKDGECVGDPMSCLGHCGDQAPGGCWCDNLCGEVDDCCEDACDECPDDTDKTNCCTPNCDGKFCGDDGCGGTCGTCSDNDPCTIDGCTESGQCQFQAKKCETPAGNQCLTASCDPESGECVEEKIQCGGSDECVEKKCLPESGCITTIIDCDDKNPCTVDTCLPDKGCVNEGPEGKKCTNDKQCGQKNKCVITSCSKCGVCEEKPVVCEEDDNPCTDTQCDTQKGCVTKPLVGLECASEDKCVVNKTCNSQGQCTGGDLVCELGTKKYPANSCEELLGSDPQKTSGAYWLKPQAAGEPFEVYCELETAAGGWMRVVNVGGEIPLCGFNLEFGDADNLLKGTGNTAIMGLKQAMALPFGKEVLVVLSDGNYVHYKSQNKNFTWKIIADGTLHSANLNAYSIQASINGGKFSKLSKTQSGPKGGLLMGGTINGKTGVFMGVGGFYSGNYTMDATCLSITGHNGMYVGNALPSKAGWGMSGAIYIR